ncbi:MAG: substrate-binding domain-containing protein [Bryobacteraceae bacterium]
MKWVPFCGSYEPSAGARFAQSFLEKRREITAIVMGNDALALGFMRVMRQRGARIPEDISVAGFDDVPEGALVWPGLTTVAQPMREMGKAACRTLFESIAAPIDLQTIEFSKDRS